MRLPALFPVLTPPPGGAAETGGLLVAHPLAPARRLAPEEVRRWRARQHALSLAASVWGLTLLPLAELTGRLGSAAAARRTTAAVGLLGLALVWAHLVGWWWPSRRLPIAAPADADAATPIAARLQALPPARLWAYVGAHLAWVVLQLQALAVALPGRQIAWWPLCMLPASLVGLTWMFNLLVWQARASVAPLPGRGALCRWAWLTSMAAAAVGIGFAVGWTLLWRYGHQQLPPPRRAIDSVAEMVWAADGRADRRLRVLGSAWQAPGRLDVSWQVAGDLAAQAAWPPQNARLQVQPLPSLPALEDRPGAPEAQTSLLLPDSVQAIDAWAQGLATFRATFVLASPAADPRAGQGAQVLRWSMAAADLAPPPVRLQPVADGLPAPSLAPPPGPALPAAKALSVLRQQHQRCVWARQSMDAGGKLGREQGLWTFELPCSRLTLALRGDGQQAIASNLKVPLSIDVAAARARGVHNPLAAAAGSTLMGWGTAGRPVAVGSYSALGGGTVWHPFVDRGHGWEDGGDLAARLVHAGDDGYTHSLSAAPARLLDCRLLHLGARLAVQPRARVAGACGRDVVGVGPALAAQLPPPAPWNVGTSWAMWPHQDADVIGWQVEPSRLVAPVALHHGGQLRLLPQLEPRRGPHGQGEPLGITFAGSYALIGGVVDDVAGGGSADLSVAAHHLVDLQSQQVVHTFTAPVLDVQFWPEPGAR